jgi:glutamate---cysteine ligase / carboxylate-amine ligase
MTVSINKKRPLHLFEGYGVEMEYMIVDRDTLNVLPITDRVLEKVAGKVVNEISRNGTAWSNELVLHVIEIKTDGPALSMTGLGAAFHQQVKNIEEVLKEFNGRLMPGAIHPWMDPYSEIRLWPHEYNPIYEAYNRIFDCRGHGWANLQSTHLNLPFYGDLEFEKLHAALRIILPLIPAIAASSPIADGEIKPFLDFRMEKYRTNSVRVPSITGKIVPEAVFSKADYREKIFEKMYSDIKPFDADGILQDEWLNSRGAMSRWDRNAIEVRVIDIQEHPAADIAILEWIVNLVRTLTNETWCTINDQKSWHEEDLYTILMDVVKYGEKAEINNRKYLSLFGLNKESISAGELCRSVFEQLKNEYDFSIESQSNLDLIFEEGPLARRILNSIPNSFNKSNLYNTYSRLSDCLRDGTQFTP